MELFKVKLTKEQLQRVPEPEMLFFIQLTQFANEIFCLKKFTFFSVSLDGDDPLLKCASNSQALFMVRLTAGKLWEAWELLRRFFFSTTLSQEYESTFSEKAKKNLSFIKTYFSNANLVKKIRDEYAFHYSSEASDNIKELIKELKDDDEFYMYFNQHHGNCFYCMSDTLMNHSLYKSINSTDTKEAINRMLVEIANASGHFLHFVGECVLVFGKRYLDFKTDTIKISGQPAIDEVHVPYFVSKPQR